MIGHGVGDTPAKKGRKSCATVKLRRVQGYTPFIPAIECTDFSRWMTSKHLSKHLVLQAVTTLMQSSGNSGASFAVWRNSCSTFISTKSVGTRGYEVKVRALTRPRQISKIKKRSPVLPSKASLPNSQSNPMNGVIYCRVSSKEQIEGTSLESQGQPLSPQSLDNFFRNPYYTGILVDPWSKEEHEGKHVPMVRREGFARVQQIISRRNRSLPHQKERLEFPLRGLVRCHKCRVYMTASFSRGRSHRYPYYHCANPKCEYRKSYPVGLAHDEFAAFLNTIAPKPLLVEQLGGLIIQAAEGRRTFQKTIRARKEAELARIHKQSQELIRMRMEGLVTDQEFSAEKTGLVERRTSIEAAYDSDPLNPKSIQQEIDQIKKPLSELEETWRILSPQLRRRFERAVLPVGFVNGQIRTAERALLFSTFADIDERKTTAVASVVKNWNQIWREIQQFAGIIRDSRET